MEINVKGIKIAYSDVGEGTPVLMLHGWGANKESFGRIISTLSEGYRVIALDLPGFGGSEEPKEPMGVDGFCDVVLEFIKLMNLESIILVGHSFGGRIIIKISSRNDLPFEIQRIVLIDSAGIKPKRSFGYKVKVGFYKAGKKILAWKPVKALFPNALVKLQNRNGSSDYKNASQVMRGCLVMAVNEDLTDLLSSINSEVLLIWGTADDATPLSDAKLMEKLIPNAGLAEIKGAGHFSWIDSPAIFDSIIRSYFNL